MATEAGGNDCIDRSGRPPEPERDWLWPCFSAPNVRAVMTTRAGGISAAPYEGLNLRPGIGDDEAAVRENRRRLHERLGVPSLRVDQVHGAAVQRFGATATEPADGAVLPVADASVTAAAGLACEIQVADCLPVLFADRRGRAVGAAHAGWRGMAGGVLEATLAAVCELAGTSPDQVEAWLGPCIGFASFEVGADVLQAFGVAPQGNASDRFARRHPAPALGGAAEAGDAAVPKWSADLAGLARERLRAAGVVHLAGNDGGADWCTVTHVQRYFSYRRDRQTGRMAALIWRAA